jgi:hypothetical protein
MVTLIFKGGSIELSEREKFQKVSKRIEAAKQNRLDYELGNTKDFSKGDSTKIMFFTDLGEDNGEWQGEGRIFLDIGDVIGCTSDEYKDGGGAFRDEDDDSDDDDGGED